VQLPLGRRKKNEVWKRYSRKDITALQADRYGFRSGTSATPAAMNRGTGIFPISDNGAP
jgi:hypothetical protein